jgi:choline dehydrogenase
MVKIQRFYCLLIILTVFFPIHMVGKQKIYKGHKNLFDYIIVGFGAAGAILARKLSDGNKQSVLVLEAGENNILTPETLLPNPFGPELMLSFAPNYAATYPVITPADTVINYSEGREWGGGAAHNDMQAVRPTRLDASSWALKAGNNQWSYDQILPLMKSLETYTSNGTIINPTQRGLHGPIHLTQNPSISNDSLAIAIASVTGAPFISDYNNALLSNVSTDPIQLFNTKGVVPGSRRSFSAYDFMHIGTIMDKKGRGLHGRKVRVMGNAVVSRILFDNKKAIGVQYLRNVSSKKSEQIKKVYARKKVILCAGAINTPKLLMLSGIGDAKLLNNLGIDVVEDNPNVGSHLENQYGAGVIITYSTPIPGDQIAGFIDERPYMPADSMRRMQLIGINISDTIAELVGLVLHPSSVGSVTIVSKDPLIPAKINMNMYSDATVSDIGSDAYLVVSFFKIAKAIATAMGQTVLSPTSAQYAAGDQALLEAAINPSSLIIAYHTIGTTRMSKSKKDGVVDGNLHVYGIENLMIADIGVLPLSPSGNTCYSAYIVALVAAKILGILTPPAL